MGSIGFDTMCAEVKLRMGNRSDLEPYNATTNPSGNKAGVDWYGLWVNQAYKHICSSTNLFGIARKVIIPELETMVTVATVASTATIAIPTAYTIVRYMFDSSNNTRLRWIPESKYVNYTDRSLTSAYAKPNEWCRMGQYIYLHPTPDAAYNIQVFYKTLPTDLSGDGVTEIGSEWDEPITTLATYKGMMKMRELDQANSIKTELVSMLGDVIPAAHEEERDRQEWIRPDPAHIMMYDY
jgi:hypothetical protein